MIDVSGFGTEFNLKASNTFPSGFVITSWGDDADPIDSPEYAAADTAMGPNGQLIAWSRPGVIEVGMNIIPMSDDDLNLSTLLNANRSGYGLTRAKDVVSGVLSYPSGLIVTLSKGVIVSGNLIPSLASSGRIKTRRYVFRFQSAVLSGATSLEV